jgi:hypothetical protein
MKRANEKRVLAYMPSDDEDRQVDLRQILLFQNNSTIILFIYSALFHLCMRDPLYQVDHGFFEILPGTFSTAPDKSLTVLP